MLKTGLEELSLLVAVLDTVHDGVQRPGLRPRGGHRSGGEQSGGPQRYDQFLYSFHPNFLAIWISNRPAPKPPMWANQATPSEVAAPNEIAP